MTNIKSNTPKALIPVTTTANSVELKRLLGNAHAPLKALEATVHTDGETIKSHGLVAKTDYVGSSKCPVDGTKTQKNWFISTGIYTSVYAERDIEQLVKVNQCFLDIDLADEGNMTDAEVDQVLKNLAATGYTVEDKKDAKKAGLLLNPAYTKSLCEKKATLLCEAIDATLGIKPNHVVYSGAGFHVHFVVATEDGWTDKGIQEVNAIATQRNIQFNVNARSNHHLFRKEKVQTTPSIYEAFFTISESVGIKCDAAPVDAGTRLTREIGQYNTKLSVTRVQTESIVPNVCRGEYFTAEEATAIINKVPELLNTAKSTAKVVKMVSKKQVSEERETWGVADDNFIISVNGEKMTVVELHTKLMDEDYDAPNGKQQGDSYKIEQCRMMWVTKKDGSLNAFINVLNRGKANQKLQFITPNLSTDKDYLVEGLEAGLKGYNIQAGKGTGVIKFFYAGIDSALRDFLNRNRNSRGEIKVAAEVFKEIIAKDPALADKFYYDDRLSEMYCRKSVLAFLNENLMANDLAFVQNQDEFILLSQDAVDAMQVYLGSKYGIGTHQNGFAKQLQIAIKGFKTVDTVATLIATLKHDGVLRVDTWLADLLGTPITSEMYPLICEYGRIWLLSLAASLTSQQADQEHLDFSVYPVLLGSQGAGKTSLAKEISLSSAKGLFDSNVATSLFGSISNFFGLKEGDRLHAVQSKLSIEIGEALESANKNHREDLKNFLTSPIMQGRKAYDSVWTKKPLRAYFCFSSNQYFPFSDKSGNRRFAVINLSDKQTCPTGEIDFKRLSDNDHELLKQLWSEAIARVSGNLVVQGHDRRERKGKDVESWLLSSKFYAVQAEHNLQFENQSEFELFCQDYITVGLKAVDTDWKTYGTLRKILAAAKNDGISNIPASFSTQSQILRSLGLEPVHGRNGNYYAPVSTKLSKQIVANLSATTQDNNKEINMVDVIVESKTKAAADEINAKDLMIEQLQKTIAEQAKMMAEMQAMQAKMMAEMRAMMMQQAPVTQEVKTQPTKTQAPVVQEGKNQPVKTQPTKMQHPIEQQLKEAVKTPMQLSQEFEDDEFDFDSVPEEKLQIKSSQLTIEEAVKARFASHTEEDDEDESGTN